MNNREVILGMTGGVVANTHRELVTMPWPCFIDLSLGILLVVGGLFEMLLLYDGSTKYEWHFWWGAMHIVFGLHLLIAIKLNGGWVIPCVVLGILAGEPFAFRPHFGPWIPGYLALAIPMLQGGILGFFMGLSFDGIGVWISRRTLRMKVTYEQP